jgi:hypothetical protein
MKPELAVTWTPILKQLPDEEREQARQLIEKYGETSPSNFIVELLAIFGFHAMYLQTIPAQVRIAGERAKADVQQSIDAVTGLHERTRLELNEIVSAVSRQGVAFKKVLETATAAQVKATENSVTDIQDHIQYEFSKQNLPAITNALREIESKAAESLRQAQRIHEAAKSFEEYAQERLASSEKRSRESLEKVEKINWRGAWMACISFSLAFLTIGLFSIERHLRSRSDDILAEKIARIAALIQDNKDAFMELCAAGLRIKFLETTPSQPDPGSPRQYIIVAPGALGAEMRDWGTGKAGCIFVQAPPLLDEFTRLRMATESAAKRFDLIGTNNTTNH